jgi:hypothetical protein
MRPSVVAVIFPGRQYSASRRKRGERRLIEKHVEQAGIEGRDEGIQGWLAGRDAVPVD